MEQNELIERDDWWEVTKDIDGHVTALNAPHYWENEGIYFIDDEIGVDGGGPFGDPNRVVDTSKVKYLLLTHAHEDHFGALRYYKGMPDVYYLNDKYNYARTNLTKGMRAGVSNQKSNIASGNCFTPYAPHQFSEGFVPQIDLNKQVIPGYLSNKLKAIKPFKEFTLGNHRIIPIPVSGHTPDGVIYLFPDKGWAFLGDNGYDAPIPFYQWEARLPDSNVNTFIRDYKYFYKNFRPLIKKVFPGHNHPEYEPVLLDYMFELITNIDKARVVDAGVDPKGNPLSEYFIDSESRNHRVSIIVPKGYPVSMEG